MPIPPNPALDETISVGQAGHIADHQVIADTLNDLTGQAVGQQGTEAAKPSNATMVAAGNRTGWTWYSTDLGLWWRFDGTNWVVMGGKQIYASVLRNTSGGAAQVFTTATFTKIDLFNSETQDPYGFHAVNADSLIVPTGYGGRNYHLTGVIAYSPNTAGLRIAEFRINGTMVEREESPSNVAAAECRMSVHHDVVLANGDAVTLWGYQSSGGNLALGNGAGNVYSRLSLFTTG